MWYVVCKNGFVQHTTFYIPHSRITAIVLNYKTPRNTVACVRALLKQTIADHVDVLVVDNHSNDESIGSIRNTLGHEKNVRILETAENIGYGRGNGIAMKQAETPYILIINPDNELRPEALEKMLKEMEESADIGICAPKLIHEDGTVRDSARSFPTLFEMVVKRTFLRHLFPQAVKRYLQWDVDVNIARDVDWVVGACMLIRNDLLKKIGGFDPRFFLFFEDMDLCRRAHTAGYRVRYLPEAVASDRKRRLSEGNAVSALLKKTGRIHAISALQYFWKWR